MLPEGIPERTLGWGVLNWASHNIIQPDGMHKGERWVFQPDQVAFILWFYAVDENGDYIYRRAYRERAKGTGKSPLMAALACIEFLGPVVFSHWDKNGKPVGRRHPNPRIQIAAVSKDQGRNTYSLITEMLQGPAKEKYRLDVGKTRILIQGRGYNEIIEMITSNVRTAEGARPTFVVMEETQNWVPSERGPEFASVLRRNLAKTDGRSIEVTNAPVPGENSVAEETHRAWQDICHGRAEDEDNLLFDSYSIRVEDIYDPEQALPALMEIYKDAPWIKVKTILREIIGRNIREIDARRFYFNEYLTDASTWIDKDVWEDAERKLKLKKSDLISIGFRGKKNCTAIAATRLSDGAVFLLKMWEAPMGENRTYECPYDEVDGAMRSILSKYNVVNVLASPQGYQDIIGRWAVDYEGDVEVEEFWSTSNKKKMADAIEQFESAIADKRAIHPGDENLTRHVMNCFTQEVAYGYLIRQETTYSQRYIVAAEAAVISFEAAQEAILDGALKEGPDTYVYGFS